MPELFRRLYRTLCAAAQRSRERLPPAIPDLSPAEEREQQEEGVYQGTTGSTKPGLSVKYTVRW